MVLDSHNARAAADKAAVEKMLSAEATPVSAVTPEETNGSAPEATA